MLSIPEKQVFGEDAQTCRFTGLPLESGSGALSIEEQAISNLGKLEYDLAELTQRRKDHASDLQGKITERSNVAIADAVRARAGIVTAGSAAFELANLDTTIRNMQGRTSALAAEHEFLAVKIAEVRARLTEEGILAKYGEAAAGTWRSMVHNRGWS